MAHIPPPPALHSKYNNTKDIFASRGSTQRLLALGLLRRVRALVPVPRGRDPPTPPGRDLTITAITVRQSVERRKERKEKKRKKRKEKGRKEKKRKEKKRKKVCVESVSGVEWW